MILNYFLDIFTYYFHWLLYWNYFKNVQFDENLQIDFFILFKYHRKRFLYYRSEECLKNINKNEKNLAFFE